MNKQKRQGNLLFLLSLIVLLTVISGLILRIIYITKIPNVNFTNLMHAHSHTAILGWVYLAMIILFYQLLVKRAEPSKAFMLIYKLTFVVTVLMFIFFVIQGYGLLAIIFSSLHIIVTYAFLIYFYPLLKKALGEIKGYSAALFIKGSIIFLIIASIGPWLLAYWNAASLPKNFTYDILVHTFLHFQINGWVTLAIIGLLLFIIEEEAGPIKSKILKSGFILYVISLLPTIILNIDWTSASLSLMPVAIIGWALKFTGTVMIVYSLVKEARILVIFKGWAAVFLALALLSFVTKTFIEVGNTVPFLINIFMYSRNVTVGYLHLALIGFASFALVSLFIKVDLIKYKKKLAYYCLIIGFISYVLFLFADGVFSVLFKLKFTYINYYLLVTTLIITAGTFILMLSKKTNQEKN